MMSSVKIVSHLHAKLDQSPTLFFFHKIGDPLYTTFQKIFTIIRIFLKSEAPKALYSSHSFIVSALIRTVDQKSEKNFSKRRRRQAAHGSIDITSSLDICEGGLIPRRHKEGHIRQLSNWDA